jgi:Lamin Tail Domain/Secretion system C-terminal sorting domain
VSDPVLTGTANGDVWIEAYYENANPISGLIINEVSAASTNATDEFGETEDWIELYNSSSASILLDNIFITDNLQTKLKHVFPAGSGTINPGEYKLIWADNQTGQSKLHTNFRLSADGEQVGLYHMVGSELNTLDEVTFVNHTKNITASRIPNLTGPIVLTALPTPATENIFETVTGVEEETIFQFYPNPVTDLLTIEVSEPARIRLINMQGTTVLSFSADGKEQLSLAHLLTGLYVLRISNSTKVITSRIVKQ